MVGELYLNKAVNFFKGVVRKLGLTYLIEVLASLFLSGLSLCGQVFGQTRNSSPPLYNH